MIPQACKSSCDAINFFKLNDLDGTTIGFGSDGSRKTMWEDGSDITGEPFTIMSEFNPAQARADKCRAHALTRSIVCRGFKTARLVLESDPARFVDRRLGPTTITKYGATGDIPKFEIAENRTFWSVGPFPQGCSCQKHFAQFTFDVEVGFVYDLYTSAVLQDHNRISFFSKDPSECVLAKVFFSKPQTVEVKTIAGKKIPAKTDGVPPTVTDPSGTNMVNPQERLLYVQHT